MKGSPLLIMYRWLIILFFNSWASAQLPGDSAFSLHGYAEIYYLYDFGKPANHKRPSFIYSHNRASEVNLNLGYIQLTYRDEKVRGSLALMAGTYTQANMVNEPEMLRPIYEASVGVKISHKQNLWVDAGIFGSHIGFEVPKGIDCPNLTRSMVADNSPYYEAGAKINYTSANGRWFLSALVLNGWQRIQKVDGNSLPSFGHQVTYSSGSKFRVNSSSFIGTDDPDSTRRMRYYHNLFSTWILSPHWEFTGGFDCGLQQKHKGSKDFNAWYLPVLIVRYLPNKKWAMAIRAEYFSDKGEVIAASPATGFLNAGYSLNADRWIAKKVCWRVEARLFSSPDEMFIKDGQPVRNNFTLGTALALQF